MSGLTRQPHCEKYHHLCPSTSTSQFVLSILTSTLSRLDPIDPIHDASPAVVSVISTRPDVAISLAHHKLHIYPFKDVPSCWRRVYEEGTLWKIVRILEGLQSRQIHETNGGSKELGLRIGHAQDEPEWLPPGSYDVVGEVIRLCDMALILTGAPGRRALFEKTLAAIDADREPQIPNPSRTHHELEDDDGNDDSSDATSDTFETWRETRPAKRRRLSDSITPARAIDVGGSISRFPSGRKSMSIPQLQKPVLRLPQPSLPRFSIHMHKQATPIVLTGTIAHWPALQHWVEPQYWSRKTHGGRRMVPVEVGRSYTDEGWGQKIMTFQEFMDGYLVTETPSNSLKSGKYNAEDMNHLANKLRSTADMIKGKDVQTGYLAQHDLMTQIPALRNDIAIPDYCYVDPPRHTTTVSTNLEDLHTTEPLLNIWLGPAHTISPAHTDPHHNILAQVVGRKYVRLFAPSETPKMYPMSGGARDGDDGAGEPKLGAEDSGVDMGNTSQVDVGVFVDGDGGGSGEEGERKRTQAAKFPLFESAVFVDCVLEPGECLYIPRGWWHYVRSLEVSCSVSFWWD